MVIPRNSFRALAALADSRSGVAVLWIAGNHDCWGGEILRRDIGVDYHVGAWEGNLAGWKARIEHGDGLRDKEDRGYRVFAGHPPPRRDPRLSRAAPRLGKLARGRKLGREPHLSLARRRQRTSRDGHAAARGTIRNRRCSYTATRTWRHSSGRRRAGSSRTPDLARRADFPSHTPETIELGRAARRFSRG